MYNDCSRTWKHKQSNSVSFDANKAAEITEDKFLDTDNESLRSSDDDTKRKSKPVAKPYNDYSFDEDYEINNAMAKVIDMSYMSSDHDVMFNSSILTDAKTGDDSFFLTKKNMDGDGSLAKADDAEAKPAAANPILNLSRIQKLRKMKGALIHANKMQDHDHIDSVFNNESSLRRHISLSLYSRPKSLMDRKPASSDYEDNAYPSAAKDRRGLMRNAPLEKYQSNHSEQRLRQIEEISNLKEELTKNDINCSVTTIEKAILFPEDRPEEKRKFPIVHDLLFKDPFAKPAKKKKKGKKKK